jgi:hypothetical protein
MKVGVTINSPLKGFLVSVAKEFERRGHDVFFIARDRQVKEAIEKIDPQMSGSSIEVKNRFQPKSYADVVSECVAREHRYGESFSMLTSYDRALGKGYLYNADTHPDIIRSWWPKEDKYREILNELDYYEEMTEKYRPDLIVGFGQNKHLSLVCRARGIKYLTFTNPRYGSRYFWVETEYEENLKLNLAVKKHLKELAANPAFSQVALVQSEFAKFFFQQMKYTHVAALRDMLKYSLMEFYKRMRGTHKRNSYRFMGWNRSLWQGARAYRYFKIHGKGLEALKGSRAVLYPMQTEPETSLMALSPEFNSSIEIITWISKSLPADGLLVVKEHPGAFGCRSNAYYDHLMRMSNVVLARPDLPSRAWLEACHVVAVITGTMGFEAIFAEKPVLCFGKHQIINELPTVRYADSYETTRLGLTDLLALKPGETLFKISKEALHRAQEDVTVDLKGFEKIIESTELHRDLAEKAVDNLYKVYAEIFHDKASL